MLPEAVRRIVGDSPYTLDGTGMSGAGVRLYDGFVLKIEHASPENAVTVEVMRWLSGKVPVPEVLAFGTQDGLDYTLMTRMKGEMATSRAWLSRPEALMERLAETVRLLWSVDPSGCPRTGGLDKDLAEAERRVRLGLVDVGNAEPDTFGPHGFRDPADLFEWLVRNRPREDTVLSHGDLCLPNIFLKDGALEGLIDLGGCGTGDRWDDVALCLRSLKHNLDGHYGGPVYPEPDLSVFFRALGTDPDTEKIRYFTLLDELF